MDIFPETTHLGPQLFLLTICSKSIAHGCDALRELYGAGIIGSLVIPVLGAVPDSIIIIFSILGTSDPAKLQDNISVGLGQMVGATCLLITLPLAVSVFLGSRQLDENGVAMSEYRPISKHSNKLVLRPRLPQRFSLWENGITALPSTPVCARWMLMTTITYLFVQIPSILFHKDKDSGAKHERWFIFVGFVASFLMFVVYLWFMAQDTDSDDLVEERRQRGNRFLAWTRENRNLISTIDPVTLFDVLDSDRDGFLDSEDLLTGLRLLGYQDISSSDSLAIFNLVDNDNNVLIDMAEWTAFVREFILADQPPSTTRTQQQQSRRDQVLQQSQSAIVTTDDDIVTADDGDMAPWDEQAPLWGPDQMSTASFHLTSGGGDDLAQLDNASSFLVHHNTAIPSSAQQQQQHHQLIHTQQQLQQHQLLQQQQQQQQQDDRSDVDNDLLGSYTTDHNSLSKSIAPSSQLDNYGSLDQSSPFAVSSAPRSSMKLSTGGPSGHTSGSSTTIPFPAHGQSFVAPSNNLSGHQQPPLYKSSSIVASATAQPPKFLRMEVAHEQQQLQQQQRHQLAISSANAPSSQRQSTASSNLSPQFPPNYATPSTRAVPMPGSAMPSFYRTPSSQSVSGGGGGANNNNFGPSPSTASIAPFASRTGGGGSSNLRSNARPAFGAASPAPPQHDDTISYIGTVFDPNASGANNSSMTGGVNAPHIIFSDPHRREEPLAATAKSQPPPIPRHIMTPVLQWYIDQTSPTAGLVYVGNQHRWSLHHWAARTRRLGHYSFTDVNGQRVLKLIKLTTPLDAPSSTAQPNLYANSHISSSGSTNTHTNATLSTSPRSSSTVNRHAGSAAAHRHRSGSGVSISGKELSLIDNNTSSSTHTGSSFSPHIGIDIHHNASSSSSKQTPGTITSGNNNNNTNNDTSSTTMYHQHVWVDTELPRWCYASTKIFDWYTKQLLEQETRKAQSEQLVVPRPTVHDATNTTTIDTAIAEPLLLKLFKLALDGSHEKSVTFTQAETFATQWELFEQHGVDRKVLKVLFFSVDSDFDRALSLFHFRTLLEEFVALPPLGSTHRGIPTPVPTVTDFPPIGHGNDSPHDSINRGANSVGNAPTGPSLQDQTYSQLSTDHRHRENNNNNNIQPYDEFESSRGGAATNARSHHVDGTHHHRHPSGGANDNTKTTPRYTFAQTVRNKVSFRSSTATTAIQTGPGVHSSTSTSTSSSDSDSESDSDLDTHFPMYTRRQVRQWYDALQDKNDDMNQNESKECEYYCYCFHCEDYLGDDQIVHKHGLSLQQLEEEGLTPQQLRAHEEWTMKFYGYGSLTLGMFLILLFSDPLVHVITDLAAEIKIPSFYISFVVLPFVSNSSELITGFIFAREKTNTSIALTLSSLLGAAIMNNTFCVSIFFFLLWFKKLPWVYTAEVVVVMAAQIIVGVICLRQTLRQFHAVLCALIFPLSVISIWVLEYKLGLKNW